MSAARLKELEEVQNSAFENYFAMQEAAQAATQQKEAAIEAFKEAEEKFAWCQGSKEAMDAARQIMKDAKAAEETAYESLAAAAEEAQAAADAVEEVKQEIRDNRKNDTTYVVHCARIECPYGMRESYLALDVTHGVLTRQIPQMTAKDIVLDTNIINFGGCHSRENPDVQKLIEETNAMIEERKDWRDNVAEFFTKAWNYGADLCHKGMQLLGKGEEEKTEEEVIEEQSADFVGECRANFPANAEWSEGHEKVFINGEPVMMRRCSIVCNYGGCITILVSGQPE